MAYDNGFSNSFTVFRLNEMIKFDKIYGICWFYLIFQT